MRWAAWAAAARRWRAGERAASRRAERLARELSVERELRAEAEQECRRLRAEAEVQRLQLDMLATWSERWQAIMEADEAACAARRLQPPRELI